MLIVLALETHLPCLRSASAFVLSRRLRVPADTVSPNTLLRITRAARRYWSAQFGHISRIVQIAARPVRSARPFAFLALHFSVCRGSGSRHATGTSICIELFGRSRLITEQCVISAICELGIGRRTIYRLTQRPIHQAAIYFPANAFAPVRLRQLDAFRATSAAVAGRTARSDISEISIGYNEPGTSRSESHDGT